MNHGRAFYSIFSMMFQYVIPIITVTVVSGCSLFLSLFFAGHGDAHLPHQRVKQARWEGKSEQNTNNQSTSICMRCTRAINLLFVIYFSAAGHQCVLSSQTIIIYICLLHEILVPPEEMLSEFICLVKLFRQTHTRAGGSMWVSEKERKQFTLQSVSVSVWRVTDDYFSYTLTLFPR